MNSFLLHVRFKPTNPVFKQSETAHAVDYTAAVKAQETSVNMCAKSHSGDTCQCTVNKQTEERKYDTVT
jgi:hypothetical protein